MNGEGAAAQPGLTQHDLLVGGQLQAAAAGRRYRVASPATGADIADLAAAESEDVDRAVAAAQAAFDKYVSVTYFERARWCENVAAEIDARSEGLARELTMEQGKPLAESRGEVASAAAGFRLAAAEGRRLTGQTVPVADPNKRVLNFRRPTGVWAVITPWNFPFNIPVEYLGPALATGNAVVWKPAPSTSRIAARLAECITAAGVPGGLVNLVTGPSLDMARHLSSHPGLIGVCFTGSSAVGKQIAQLAAGKKLLLELGGNGPVIVLHDADLERTVQAVAAAAFANAGQSCAAAGRILAEPGVHGALVAGLADAANAIRVGSPLSDDVDMGPVHNEATAQKMEQHIEDALGRNGNVVAGGARLPGMPSRLFFAPTVIEALPGEALVLREETFGPIAPVLAADGDDALLAAAASSRLGLSSAIFTRDIPRALRLAERLNVGQVVINDTSNYWELHMPFGGWPGTDSGIGRLGGRHTLEALTEIRSVSIDVSS
jgi:succinate-semialdehyde dehydrogenase/glutarate-semialdehyde dehydrogenase